MPEVRFTGVVRRAAAAVAGLLFVACAAPASDADTAADDMAQTPAVSPADRLLLASAKVALPPAGTRLEDLPAPESPGAIATQQYCTACHALPNPTMHSATDWPGVVRRMWLRMAQLGPDFTVPVPEMGQRVVLLDYLTANALKVNEGNLPDGPMRQVFVQTCAQCHELPDPHQHSEQDWYVVVRRMNQHMQDLLDRTLPSEDIDRIVQYLASAS